MSVVRRAAVGGLVILMSGALSGTVYGQDASPDASPGPSGAVTPASPGPSGLPSPSAAPIDDPAADLWLLYDQHTVRRLDGVTGEVVADIDVTTEDCHWERAIVGSDGALWVMDDAEPGGLDVEVSRFCFGRFPIEGGEGQIHSVVPTGDADIYTDGSDVWDGTFLATGRVLQYQDLLRVDLTTGDLSSIKGVPGFAVQGGQLYLVSDPKYRSAGKPATLDPDSGKRRKLDLGLKRRETVSSVEAGADGLVLYWDFGTFFVHDPATGTTTRLKDYDEQPYQVTLTKEGLWGVFRVRSDASGSGLDLQRIGSKGKPKVVVECAEPCMSGGIVGVTPGAIWVELGSIDPQTGGVARRLLRVDRTTLETTLELDPAGLIEPSEG